MKAWMSSNFGKFATELLPLLAGNENIYNISDEFEIRPDRTKDNGVGCP